MLHIRKLLLCLPSHPSPAWNSNGSFCSTLDNEQDELQVSRGFVLSVDINNEREPGLTPCFLLTISWEEHHVAIHVSQRHRNRNGCLVYFRYIKFTSKQMICPPLQVSLLFLKKADWILIWFTRLLDLITQTETIWTICVAGTNTADMPLRAM